MPDKYLYLLINALTLLGPFARSFEPRIAFYAKWRPLFISLALTGTFFILWDSLFTHLGVWGFNPRYLTGPGLLGLPMEEWLFFITVPYACVFVYEVLALFIVRNVLGRHAKLIASLLILFNAVLFLANLGKLYTMSACGLAIVLLFLHAFVWKSPWLGRFFLAYTVCLIPFLIVNGVLTGSFIAEPVVWYNDAENMGFRIATIPFEDVFYGMDLILLNVGGYLWLRR